MLVADAARRENRTKSLRDDDDDVDLDDVDAFVEDDALCKGLHDDKAWWCEAEESVDGIIFFFLFRRRRLLLFGRRSRRFAEWRFWSDDGVVSIRTET